VRSAAPVGKPRFHLAAGNADLISLLAANLPVRIGLGLRTGSCIKTRVLKSGQIFSAIGKNWKLVAKLDILVEPTTGMSIMVHSSTRGPQPTMMDGNGLN
jgi:hypothetical protein